MADQERTDPFDRRNVEVIMDVEKLIRASIANSMRMEDILLQMLHHLNSNEEEHENYRHQFVDLERRHAQVVSEVAALREEVKGVKRGLR